MPTTQRLPTRAPSSQGDSEDHIVVTWSPHSFIVCWERCIDPQQIRDSSTSVASFSESKLLRCIDPLSARTVSTKMRDKFSFCCTDVRKIPCRPGPSRNIVVSLNIADLVVLRLF